jgi:hypothetical protein
MRPSDMPCLGLCSRTSAAITGRSGRVVGIDRIATTDHHVAVAIRECSTAAGCLSDQALMPAVPPLVASPQSIRWARTARQAGMAPACCWITGARSCVIAVPPVRRASIACASECFFSSRRHVVRWCGRSTTSRRDHIPCRRSSAPKAPTEAPSRDRSHTAAPGQPLAHEISPPGGRGARTSERQAEHTAVGGSEEHAQVPAFANEG